MKLKNFTPAIVLGTICLVVAALLASINHFTAPKIAENERIARTASLRAVFGGDESGADFGDPMKNIDAFVEKGSYVDEVYEEKNGMGYAVTLVVPKGFEAEIDLTVGVGTDGKVTGVVITKYEDSLGKDKMPDAVNRFVGKNSADGVELVSGATYSSEGVRKAVSDALYTVGKIEKAKAQSSVVSLTSLEEGGGTDEVALATEKNAPIEALSEAQIFEIAKPMLSGASGFTFLTEIAGIAKEGESIDPNWVPNITKIYKETSGKGYAVYGETFNPWGFGAIESNFVFVIDNEFTVIDFDLLSWSLSASYQYGDEKSEGVHIYLNHREVERLEKSFIGADLMNFGTKVDLVTKATLTALRIHGAVFDALDNLNGSDHESDVQLYKTVGAVAFFAGIAAFGVAIYFQKRRRV